MADRAQELGAVTRGVIRAKWANSEEWFAESFGTESTPKTPPNLALRLAAAALGIAAALALAAWVLTPDSSSAPDGLSCDRGASQ